MYAAHVLRDWNFKKDWPLLQSWAKASEKYDEDDDRPCFEEALNYFRNVKMEDMQLDLLLPIKPKTEESK